MKYLRFIGVWLVVPLAIVSLPFELPELTCLGMAYLYLGGPVLLVLFSTLFILTRKKPQAAVALVLTAVLWSLSIWYGFSTGARIHLLVNEARYAKRIKEIARAQTPEAKAQVCGSDCMTSKDGQLIVFHYCHCPMFWPDLVFDPSGRLEADANDLKKIDFYLMSTRHLTTFWYIGYFGD